MCQFFYYIILLCFSKTPEMLLTLSFPAMAAEENKGNGNGSSVATQRQRFYVELKYGETTIVSWKKLLKEGQEWKKDQCLVTSSGPYSSSSSTVLETQDISCDAGQHNDSVIMNKTVKHGAMSSDHIQQIKHKVKMTNVKGEKNDGDSAVQLAKPNEMNGKVTSENINLFKQSSSPAKVKDHPPKEVRASMLDVPLLTYSKRRKAFRNTSINGNDKKAGVGGHSYDAMHQKTEECSPVKIDSMTGMLHKSPLKDSKAEKFKEIKSEISAMDHKSVDFKTKHVRAPGKKRKATDSSNDCSDSPVKSVKLSLVPQKTNVKVRFLLKPEHETLESNQKPAKDDSSTAASAM